MKFSKLVTLAALLGLSSAAGAAADEMPYVMVDSEEMGGNHVHISYDPYQKRIVFSA